MTAEEKQQVLDQFGEMLMREVRDEALDTVRRILNGEVNSPWRQAFARELVAANFTESQKELVWKAVLLAVDEAIGKWLVLIDGESTVQKMQMLVKSAKTGAMVNLWKCSDGLPTEPFFKDDGWVVRFSQYPPSWVV